MGVRTRRVGNELWVKPLGEPWRPATAQEQVGEETGGLQAFGIGVASYPGQMLEMLKPLAVGAMPVTASEQPLSAPVGPVQAAENVSQFRPGAVMAGQLAPDLATLPLGFSGAAAATRGARAGTERMAERVVGRIRATGARQGEAAANDAVPPAPSGEQLLDDYGLPKHESLGAAAVREPKTLLERVQEEFLGSMELTDQQKAAKLAVQTGKVRFQPLPGQMEGSRLMLSAVKSNPMWLREFEPELVANYTEGSRLIKQALGLPDGVPLTDDIFDVAESTIGTKFDTVRQLVREPIKLSEEALQVAEPALSPWQRKAIQLTEGEGEKAVIRPLPAEEVFELRSRLNNLTRELARNGEINALDDVVKAIDEIDDAIEAQVGPEGMKLWQEARNQWRVKLMVEATNGISKDGRINAPTLANAAMKMFRKQYRGFGPRKGLPEPTRELLDWLKVANAFPDAVGNSGTAERMVSMQALTNPVEYAKQRATGKAIRYVADSMRGGGDGP